MVVQARAQQGSERVRPAEVSGTTRIAVVIPCFNDGEFVGEAVASIREAEPVEVMVVDDGSTDELTAAVLAEIAQSGAASVVHRENGGLSAARMTGVAATTAPYVFPLDADDVIAHGSLGPLADRLDEDSSIAFTYGHGEYLHEGFGWRARPWDAFTLLYLNGWGPSCLFRRDALTDAGGWTHNDCYEDWDFLLSLAERGYAGAPVDRLVLRYRRHQDPRLYRRCLERHAVAYRQLRERHAPLFARREQLESESHLGWWQRFWLPLRHGSRPLLPFRLYWWLRGQRSLRPRT